MTLAREVLEQVRGAAAAGAGAVVCAHASAGNHRQKVTRTRLPTHGKAKRGEKSFIVEPGVRPVTGSGQPPPKIYQKRIDLKLSLDIYTYAQALPLPAAPPCAVHLVPNRGRAARRTFPRPASAGYTVPVGTPGPIHSNAKVSR